MHDATNCNAAFKPMKEKLFTMNDQSLEGFDLTMTLCYDFFYLANKRFNRVLARAKTLRRFKMEVVRTF